MTTDAAPASGGLEELVSLARSLGATRAAVIPADAVTVEDDLAGLCREPRCPSYGVSASCPPHVSGPSGFRQLLEGFRHAVVFKIEVPREILLSSERREIFRLLHEVAAGIEAEAKKRGHSRSRAFAGGSCKGLFCAEEAGCRVVDEGGPCRNPDRARPSMSGFGINVSRLMAAAGWPMNRTVPAGEGDAPETGTVSGLVLVG
jgi:predicted metal-binding protein